jgi:hypothetical protein
MNTWMQFCGKPEITATTVFYSGALALSYPFHHLEMRKLMKGVP